MKMSREYYKIWREKNREKIRVKNKIWREANKEKWSIRIKNWEKRNPEKTLYTRLKSNAKVRGVEFSLRLEDISFPEYCPILGIKLDYDMDKGRAQSNSPSFDRINPSKGYTHDNIQIVSRLANLMKNNATPEQLLAFGQWAVKTYGSTQ